MDTGHQNATENLNNAKTDATKNTANNDGVRYQSRITDSDIKALHNIAQTKGKISINDFNAQEIRDTEKWARKFYQELDVKSPYFRAWFGDWRAYDTQFAYTTNISNKVNMIFNTRTVRNSDTKWNIQITKDVFGDSLHYAGKQKLYIERLLTDIDDVLQKAILLDTSISEKNTANKKGSTQFMYYMYSIIEYNGNPFLARFSIEEYGTNGKKRAYNVQRIKMSTLSRAQYSQIKSAYRGKFASNVDAITIADLHSLVKQYDKNFNPKPVNKILLNDDGTPKVFYHGSGQQFTEFKPEEMSIKEGSYFFAENKEDAQAYGRYIFEVYLTGEKLADYDNQSSEFYHLRDERKQVDYLRKKGYDGWYADMDSERCGGKTKKQSLHPK